MNIGELIHFLYDMGETLVDFSLKVFEFITYEIPLIDMSVGSVIFGVGIGVYLSYQAVKWAV